MKRTTALALAGAATVGLAACSQAAPARPSGDVPPGTVTVVSTGDGCEVSATTAPSGTLSFSVRNDGEEATGFALLAEDRLRVVGEVEDLGPGLTRDLVLTAAPGTYWTACTSATTGGVVRAPFAVSGSGEPPAAAGGDDAALAGRAGTRYAGHVRAEAGRLVTATGAFAAAVTAGDDAEARRLYPAARVHWERIETVAEGFGDLDPRMDAREADLGPGQGWTGWHALEKDLWPPASGYAPLGAARRAEVARLLVADTVTLHRRTLAMRFTADQVGAAARGLLDEVATRKVTGEEEVWSRTDLWDCQANADGARVAWEALRPLLRERDAALDAQVGQRFARLQALLDAQRDGDGFVPWTDLTPQEVKALSDAAVALADALSRLTPAVR